MSKLLLDSFSTAEKLAILLVSSWKGKERQPGAIMGQLTVKEDTVFSNHCNQGQQARFQTGNEGRTFCQARA